jgi:hypothetical protein
MKPAAAQAAEWWQGAVLIIPPFFFLKERGRRKGLGIGAQFDPLAASSWWGALYGAVSSGSCVLVGALIAVLWTVLEKLISLEVQLVKLLISNSRHVV